MASAGPNAPGTMADDSAVGTLTWSNPDNAKTSNDLYAIATNSSTAYTHYLKATNFGFAIPAGSTINGITVSIERWGRLNTPYYYVEDSVIKLVKAGSISGDNKSLSAKWSQTDTVATYGGVSDLWGNTLSAEDINNAAFGVVFQARILSSKDTVQAKVDFISITVTYTEGGGGASAVPVITNQYRQRRS